MENYIFIFDPVKKSYFICKKNNKNYNKLNSINLWMNFFFLKIIKTN